MTVSSEISFVSYNGDGSTRTFPIPFYFLEDSDLVVNVVDADGTTQHYALGTDYTVSGAGQQSGGTITLLGAAVPGGKTLQIERDPPVTQETAYQANDPFPAQAHEKALDKLTMIAQRLNRTFTNALHFPLTESNDGTLPQKSERALNVLGFDELGNPTMLPIPASVGAGELKIDVFVAGVGFEPGVTTTLPLSRSPGSPNNLLVFFDTEHQGPDQWNVVGSTLTFTDPIPDGVLKVFVRIGTTLSTQVPPPGSVGDDQLQWSDVLNRVVDSIAALRTLSTTRYKRAFVLGYHAKGDGGGGAYWLDTTDSASVDNGGTVIVAADGGRWKLATTGPISIKQFGAKMDDSTDDAPSIQAAIDWVLSQPGGGQIWIPVGTSRISKSIRVPVVSDKDFVMVGCGVASKFRATGTMAMFDVGAESPAFGTNYMFRDFGIVQPTSGTVVGVLLRNVNGARLEGLDISNVNNGVVLQATYNPRITGCRFYGCGNSAITTAVTGTNGAYIWNNVISTCVIGINLLVGGNNIVVRDNNIEACGISLGITNYTSVLVQGNYIEANTAEFIFFGGTNYEIDIVQNWFGVNSVPTNIQNIIGGSFVGNTVWGSVFTQTTNNLADFIIGKNLLQNGASIPSTHWTVPSFINGYSNYGNAHQAAGFIKDRAGFVCLRGVVKGSTDAAAFVLPPGYRPGAIQNFAGAAVNGTTSRVSVYTDGFVTPVRGTDGTMDLSTVRFTPNN